MSYDLAVFDPREELKSRSAFAAWYDGTEEYGADGSYDDDKQTTPALQRWFHDMREHFIPRSGPYGPKGLECADIERALNRSADYNFGPDLIYVSFLWSQTEAAYELCFSLAAKHGVGFIDASGDEGAVWFPGMSGSLVKVHVHEASDE